MAFLPATGFGAGAGADALQQIIKQKAQEAYQNQALAQEQQRIQIESQRALSEAAYHKALIEEAQTNKAIRDAQEQQAMALKAQPSAAPNTVFQPNSPFVKTQQQGGFGDLFQQDKTLPSGNITGGTGINVGPVQPGTATGALRWMGTDVQNQGLARQAAFQRLAAANPDRADAMLSLTPDKQEALIQEYAKIDAAKQKAETPQTENVYERGPTGLRMLGTVPKGSNITNPQQPPQGPQPQVFYAGDVPHAIQFSGGKATEIPLPPGITGKAPPKESKLSQTQQAEVENYNAVIREAQNIQNLLKKTGLDQDNNPISSHSRAFIAQKLGVTEDDPSVDKLLQNVGYIQALGLRSAAGNQRMTNTLMQVFKSHVPDPNAPGKRIGLLTSELARELGDRRADVYKLAGATDPGAPAASSGFKVVEIK